MENNYMNSCGCRQQSGNCRMPDRSTHAKKPDVCTLVARPASYANPYTKIDDMPLGMAYVPTQHYEEIFSLSRGLKEGTIFPELSLPFCGKRRKCSC